MTKDDEIKLLRRFARSACKLFRHPELFAEAKVRTTAMEMAEAMERYLQVADAIEARAKLKVN